jgi:hypothetical protein
MRRAYEIFVGTLEGMRQLGISYVEGMWYWNELQRLE